MTRVIRGGGWIAALSLALALVAPSARATDDPGRVGYGFLRMGTGARVDALGSVGSTLARGSEAWAWNPALLAHATPLHVSASAMTWLDETTAGHVALSRGFGGLGVLGASVQALSVADFSNVSGSVEDGQGDLSLALGWSRHLVERLDGGLTVGFMNSSLAGESATGAMLDAGLNYRYVDGWNVGLALRDFGPSVGYGEGPEDQLPTQWAAGIGGKVKALRIGAELAWENGRGTDGGLGAELELFRRLDLRAGTRLGADENDASEPWSVGVGVNVARGLAIDYAFRDGILEPSHRFGLRWGAEEPETTADAPPALSGKEFYRTAVEESLDRAFVDFPKDLVDTIGIRAKTPSQTDTLITESLQRRLQALGYETVVLKAPVPIPAGLDSATAAKVADAAKAMEGETTRDVVLEYEILSSRVSIDGKRRERFIGPQVLDRSADADLLLRLLKAGETEPLWSGQGQSHRTESVAAKSVPPSSGFPLVEGGVAESKKLHPFVEPAIVVGIVSGLALIFFSNRDVGE